MKDGTAVRTTRLPLMRPIVTPSIRTAATATQIGIAIVAGR